LVGKLRAEHSLILVPFVLALWSISRVWTVLPSIMQDEYIYTSQAKNLPFAEQFYSNYLFSLVMGITNQCGTEFYTCTKTINSFFFLSTVILTLLIALRFLSFRWSVFAASVTALSPVAIPVSYFMPEAMYFAMMTLTIWLTLVVSKRHQLWLWILPGLVLGGTALVKPHAIFMLPAFTVFAFIFVYKKFSSGWIKAVVASASLVSGFMVSKLGLGFAFAGTAGLKFFGGYGSPVGAIAGAVSKPATTLAPDSTQGADPSAVPEVATGLEIFVEVATTHLLAHTAVLLLLAGIPLILSLRIGYSVIKTKQPAGELSSFFILIGLITISMIGVVSLFEAYVTASGDDHSDRLILRYYEFLIPQFVVMGLLLPRFSDSKRVLRIIQGGVTVLAIMVFTIVYPITFNKQYADSSTLPGVGDGQGVFIFLGIFVSCAVLFWIVNPERGNVVIGRFIIPAVLILSLVMSQNKLIDINGTPAYFDQAGWGTRSYLQDVPGDRILVAGQTRTEVFTVKFWIDEANIRDLLVMEGSVLGQVQVAEVDYVVTLKNIDVAFEHEVITEGEGYRLVKVVR
jgi:phosphoglycerol transferase